MCLLESKGKYLGLDFPCISSSFIFNLNCIIFYFSILLRSCLSLSFSLICSLLSCSIFSLSTFLCFSFSRSSISNLIFSCSNFSL